MILHSAFAPPRPRRLVGHPTYQTRALECFYAGLVVVLEVASEEAPWVSSAVTGLVLCHVHAVSARHDIGAEEGDLILGFLCEVALVKTEDSNGWFHFHSCRVNSWKSEVCRGKEVSD